ncbi:MAG: YceI family protein, partial [Flammeovirgaceae bacterium]|nr:YceI family protein [Flammeovirgaceae bacterium]
MKKQWIYISCIGAMLLAACTQKTTETQNQPKEEVTVASPVTEEPKPTMVDGKYTVVSDATTLKWIGKKVGGEHFGKVKVTEGSFDWANGTIAGGSFTIDFNTITVEDIPADNADNAKLTGHLKSADFFDVAKTPTATFTITKVEPITDGTGTHKITGDLAMKGKTNSIEFPATITPTADGATVTAKIVFDRT